MRSERRAALGDSIAHGAREILGRLVRLRIEPGALHDARDDRGDFHRPHVRRGLDARQRRHGLALRGARDGGVGLPDAQRHVLARAQQTNSNEDYIEAHRSLSTIYFRLGRVEEGRQEKKIAEAMDVAIQAKDQERGRSLQK